MREDCLIITAHFFCGPERAIDIADFSKKTLEHLETISPWSRPFEISGDRRSTADMPVNDDLSNFHDLLYKAWKPKRVVYYDENGVRSLKFSEYKTAPLGFSVSIGNLLQCKEDSERIDISFHMGTEYRPNIPGRNLHNSLVINIRKYREGEKNHRWAHRDVVERVMRYFISELNPFDCAAWSAHNTVCEIDGKIFLHRFIWLTYLSDKDVCTFLSDSEFAQKYHEGLWFEFGREVETVFSPDVRKLAEELGRKLISAGLNY